ncbi:MAG TPA: DUF3899 domain-containing protein [Planococcus sp. (in: firmicutes)]|nr:DUF3899 domain-containing protein [Planococcus sp. (in: firmicutes)]
MTSKLLLFSISIFSSTILSFILYTPWSFLRWLDAVFLVALLLLMAAAIMSLIEGKFFEAFIHSTKNFFAKVNKKEQLIRESEKRSFENPSFNKVFPARKNFFIIGMLLSAGSLLLSTAFYYL